MKEKGLPEHMRAKVSFFKFPVYQSMINFESFSTRVSALSE